MLSASMRWLFGFTHDGARVGGGPAAGQLRTVVATRTPLGACAVVCGCGVVLRGVSWDGDTGRRRGAAWRGKSAPYHRTPQSQAAARTGLPAKWRSRAKPILCTVLNVASGSVW